MNVLDIFVINWCVILQNAPKVEFNMTNHYNYVIFRGSLRAFLIVGAFAGKPSHKHSFSPKMRTLSVVAIVFSVSTSIGNHSISLRERT